MDNHHSLFSLESGLFSKIEETNESLIFLFIEKEAPELVARHPSFPDFLRALKVISFTLPGYVFSLMLRHKSALNFEEIRAEIEPFFDNLRKINGSKYICNHLKSLKSTLKSSNIFEEFEGKYCFKKDDIVEFIRRGIEKVDSIRVKGDKALLGNKREESTTTRSKQQELFELLASASESLCKEKRISKTLRKTLTSAKNETDFLKKISEDRFFLGALAVFRFFKNPITKSLADKRKTDKEAENLELRFKNIYQRINFLETECDRKKIIDFDFK